MAQRASAMEGRDAVSPEDFDACCRTLQSWLLACIRRWGVPIQVAEEIARLREVSCEEIARATTDNFFRLFQAAQTLN